jgi:outer membrane protein
MKKISVWIVAGCMTVSLYAQDQPAEQKPSDQQSAKLTFKEAVKIGLERNLALQKAKNTLFSRQVQRNASMAGAFAPLLYAQGQFSRNEGQQQNPENGNLEDLTIDNINGSLNAEVTLFNGLNRINTLRQNNQLFKSQTSLVKRGEQDVLYFVTSQYLQVLLDQELLRIAEENHTTQKVVLDQLREQVNQGVKAESELYTQDAQVRNMEVLALRAKVTLDNDKAKLAQTLQLDPAIPFEVTFPEAIDSPSSLENISLDSLYSLATERREDLKMQKYLAEANRLTYKASVSGYYPRVTLFASYGTFYYSHLAPPFGEQFWDQNPNLSYGVNVYIPIFDRFQTRATRVNNRVTYENSRLDYENLEKTVKIDVQMAYNNYRSAIETYNSTRVQLQAGQLALKTQEESFLLGVSNQVTLAQANQTYVTAASSAVQAEVTLIFQKILLDYAVGTLRIEDVQ